MTGLHTAANDSAVADPVAGARTPQWGAARIRGLEAPPRISPSEATPTRIGIGPWEPLWLGEPARHLYASLHPATLPAARLGVVFVGPLLHEQPRSRRLLAEVASSFAALGLPTLRFDFFGTGDSGGEGGQADFASMCADIELSMRSLRGRTGVEEVAVVAWRGGALPVARWIDEGGAPALVVAWEPVMDGASWLRELQRADAAERHSKSRYRCGAPGGTFETDGQLMGTPTSPRLLQDLQGAAFDPGAWNQPAATRTPRCWAVLRSGARGADCAFERCFELSPDAPTFEGTPQMDAGLFVTPELKRVADALGVALRGPH